MLGKQIVQHVAGLVLGTEPQLWDPIGEGHEPLSDDHHDRVIVDRARVGRVSVGQAAWGTGGKSLPHASPAARSVALTDAADPG